MNDACTYLIQLRGMVEIVELNRMSPQQMTAVHADGAATRFTIYTDQSGLIGLLRHLHALGLVFLAITRLEDGEPSGPSCEQTTAAYIGAPLPSGRQISNKGIE